MTRKGKAYRVKYTVHGLRRSSQWYGKKAAANAELAKKKSNPLYKNPRIEKYRG